MKFGKRIMSLMLALVMVLGLTVNASAATAQSIKVQLSPNITVKYNDQVQNMTDVNGNPVYPLLNDGTTYLPVRAVSGMLGIGVDWDGATQTVLLDTSKKTTPTKTDGKAPASAKPSEITVQLSRNITVELDGKIQSMEDVNGNPVYPILYNGTTYLPIRAVANMLNINVGWDGATQTVRMSSVTMVDNAAETESNTSTSTKITITIERPTVERIRKVMEMRVKMSGYPEYTIEDAVSEFKAHGPNDENGTFVYTFELSKKDTFKTSENAKTLGDKHVGCDYAEVDYSTADEGYVKVKLTKQVCEDVYCSIDWANTTIGTKSFKLKLDQWANIPLPGGSDSYQLTVKPWPSIGELPAPNFKVAFAANIEDPDAFTLLSNPNINFENSPKTTAKAAELTKNCKTDAEKITAIFEFVAKTIKYDDKADTGTSQDRSLDDVLNSKTGICVNYASLMAGMLRSQGIPCKVVCGKVYVNGKWELHAWVAVSPDTKGLNMSALGAGHEPDGWIRLDPTWGNTSSGRAKAAIDKNHQTEYAY